MNFCIKHVQGPTSRKQEVLVSVVDPWTCLLQKIPVVTWDVLLYTSSGAKCTYDTLAFSWRYVSTPTHGNWFQTNQPELELNDCAGDPVTSLCVPMRKIWHFSGKFDQYLSLYWGAVKPELQMGTRYWFLWESCEIWLPKFTNNFGIVSSKMHLKAVKILIPLKERGEKWYFRCLTPVSMVMWCLHTLWRFTLPAYKACFTCQHTTEFEWNGTYTCFRTPCMNKVIQLKSEDHYSPCIFLMTRFHWACSDKWFAHVCLRQLCVCMYVYASLFHLRVFQGHCRKWSPDLTGYLKTN